MNNNINHNDTLAGISSGISMLFASLSWMTFSTFQSALSIASTIIAIVSGILSTRYFYKAQKKIK